MEQQDEEKPLEQQVDQQVVQPEPPEAEAHSDFPIYSAFLIVGLMGVSLAQAYVGLQSSIEAAAFIKPAFISHGEYWRLLTGAALHGGPLHLAMNCYAFYSFGKIIEWLSNRAHLSIVFLLSAVGGGILSLLFVPEGTSVGASGGVVGLIGYLAAYAFVRRQFISPEFRKDLLVNIGFILVFGLVLYQVVDNYAHVGGLVTGLVYGFIQIPRDAYVDPRRAGRVAEILGVMALGFFVAVCVFSVLLILKIV